MLAESENDLFYDYCHYTDTANAWIAREIAKRVGDEMTFPGEIKVTVLRELRTVEYAR